MEAQVVRTTDRSFTFPFVSFPYIESMLDYDRDQVALFQVVREADPLSGMLDRMAPDPGIPEAVNEVPVEFPADVFNGASYRPPLAGGDPGS